jgi:pyrroline-5-carboxylate reductase
MQAGSVPIDSILGSDIHAQALQEFCSVVKGVIASPSNRDLAEKSDVLVLCIKPQKFEQAVADIVATPNQLVVSVMAGVTTARIQKALKTSRVIRTMPNTPCLIGAGAIGLAAAVDVTEDEVATIEKLLSGAGTVVRVDENQLDAVTGLSGSGPAYVLEFLLALTSGGVRAGLPRDKAYELALGTLIGAGRLAKETGLHPSMLLDQVTSPGGTTMEGLHVLRERSLAGAVEDAVLAATHRARELGG